MYLGQEVYNISLSPYDDDDDFFAKRRNINLEVGGLLLLKMKYGQNTDQVHM